MKKNIFLFMVILVFIFLLVAGHVKAEDGKISNEIFQLWKEGKFSEVFEIGEERLQENPDDLLGLILRLEKAALEVDVDVMSETFQRFDSLAVNINNAEFQSYYEYWRSAIPIMIEEGKKMTLQQKIKEIENFKKTPTPIPALADLITTLEKIGFISYE